MKYWNPDGGPSAFNQVQQSSSVSNELFSETIDILKKLVGSYDKTRSEMSDIKELLSRVPERSAEAFSAHSPKRSAEAFPSDSKRKAKAKDDAVLLSQLLDTARKHGPEVAISRLSNTTADLNALAFLNSRIHTGSAPTSVAPVCTPVSYDESLPPQLGFLAPACTPEATLLHAMRASNGGMVPEQYCLWCRSPSHNCNTCDSVCARCGGGHKMADCTVPNDALRCSLGHQGHTTTVCIIRITLGRVPNSNGTGNTGNNGGNNGGSKRKNQQHDDNDYRKKLMVMFEEVKNQNSNIQKQNQSLKSQLGSMRSQLGRLQGDSHGGNYSGHGGGYNYSGHGGNHNYSGHSGNHNYGGHSGNHNGYGGHSGRRRYGGHGGHGHGRQQNDGAQDPGNG